MTLKYWKCKCLSDSDVYSIRTKTKREAMQLKAGSENYSAPYPVTVEYTSGFDLLYMALSEGGIWEDENQPN